MIYFFRLKIVLHSFQLFLLDNNQILYILRRYQVHQKCTRR